MVLSRLTKITGPGVATDTNWVGNNADFTGITTTATSFNIGVTTIHSNLIEAHNIKSTGIITATGGSFSGNVTAVDGTFSGNVSIAGTLTYEDVTNIDAVGIITAPALDVDDFLDVGSNIKLGNAGVITATSFVGDGSGLIGVASTDNIITGTAATFNTYPVDINAGMTVAGVGTFGSLDIGGDIDVDGHTNLDNVSVAGVSTFSGNVHLLDSDNLYIGGSAGTTDGMQIYHNGNNSFLQNNNRPFYIGQNTTASEFPLYIHGGNEFHLKHYHSNGGQNSVIKSLRGGAFTLYHAAGNVPSADTIRLETTSTGINFPRDIDVDGHTNLDNVSIAGVSTFSGIVAAGIGSTAISLDNSHKITFGSAHELEMFHDGSTSYIKQRGIAYPSRLKIISENSGIDIMSGNGGGNNHGAYENAISCENNGAVKIYHAGVGPHLETYGAGIIVQGSIQVGQDITHHGDTDTKIRFPSADTISLETAGTQGVRLTSAQKLLVGDHTSSRSVGNSEHILQTEGTSASENGISIYAFNNSAHAGHFTFGKSRNNSTVADNDFLGHIIWSAHDGTDANSTAARITGRIDGTTGSNTTPGSLEFYTTPAGADNVTLRTIINSSGHVVPAADSTYDLGLTGTRWRNVYADTLYGSGANLTGINADLVNDSSPQLGGTLDTNNNNIHFNDNVSARFGTSQDFDIYHNGTNNIIHSNTGNLEITSDAFYVNNAANNEVQIKAVANGAVELYHNNIKKFETLAGGAKVSGLSLIHI